MNLTTLRLLLAACVIVAHSPELIDGDRHRELLTSIGLPFTLGELAVRGFFILSGYLIVGSWVANPSLVPFMWKRVLRIYPAFLACSVLCLAMTPLVGGSVDWPRGIGRALILHNPADAGAFPGTHFGDTNGAMWTVVFEFMCYGMVAWLGVFGWIRNRGEAVDTLLGSLAVCLIGCVVLANAQPTGVIFYAVHFCQLAPWFIVGALWYFVRAKHPAPAASTTDLSYGLYLYGWPCQKLLLWWFPWLGPWGLSGLALLMAGACAWLSWRLVEAPCLRLKHWRPGIVRFGPCGRSAGRTLP